MQMKDYPKDLHSKLNAANKLWEEIEFALKYASRALIYGRPGTGKSRAGTKFGNLQNGFVRTMITPETTAAEVRGHWVIGPKGTSWIDGPGVQAWRQGSRLLIDEIDQAGGDTIPLLHALLDDAEMAALSLATGETLKPKAGFSCVCTMNSKPQSLPEALQDRFVTKIECNAPSPELLDTLPPVLRVSAAYAIWGENALMANLKSTRTWVELGQHINKKGLELVDGLRVVGCGGKSKDIAQAIEVAHKTGPASARA